MILSWIKLDRVAQVYPSYKFLTSKEPELHG